MEQVSHDYITLSPPFSNVTADLVGPFWIKYKKRKTWVLNYFCNISKALHLQLVENYSVKAVPNPLNTVFRVRNLSNTIVRDAGRNITKTRKLIHDLFYTGFSR